MQNYNVWESCTVCVALYALMSLCLRNIVLDCSSQHRLIGTLSCLNARARRSVRYDNLLSQVVITYSKNGHGHNPVSRILTSTGHWEHNCTVNALLHHYTWYLSSTDWWYEDEGMLRHWVGFKMSIIISMLSCPKMCTVAWFDLLSHMTFVYHPLGLTD